ncbi:ABC transporter permease [Lapillicoccus sp.]|uniref:ABC transporter permease n=1 Tax=Lapillicoccus sp. TaxID=1909287 RepID=UPI003262F376
MSTATAPERAHRRAASPARLTWRRFAKNRLALTGAVFLILLGIVVVVGPTIYRALGGYGPYEITCPAFSPPISGHLLGCDALGRDFFARLLDGGRVSLTVGVAVAGLTTITGLVLGAVAGFYAGRIDNLLMRFTDTVMALPSLFLILAAAAILGPSLTNTILVLSFIEWTTPARLVRGEFLTLRERDFVLAARSQALPGWRIMRQILRNIVPTILVAGTLAMAMAILAESGLSYLGMGTQPPQASWGYMLSDAQTYFMSRPRLAVWPGLLIMLTVLAANFAGDGLRQALDPRLRGR